MSVFFKIFKILNVFLILILVSCSSKNIKKENITSQNTSEQNKLVIPNSKPNDISSTVIKKVDINKEKTTDNLIKVTEKENNNIINIPYSKNSSYENINKFGVSSSTSSLISNGLIVIDGLYFTDISSIKQKNKQILITAIDDKNVNSENYIKTYFPSSTTLAISKFKSKNKISPSEIIGFANYIGANTAVVKAFYVKDLSAYVYEISFVSTNLNKGYWNNTIKDSEPIENTLKFLRLDNLNSFLNVTAPLSTNKDKLPSSENKNETKKDINTNSDNKENISKINNSDTESNTNKQAEDTLLLSEELADVAASIENIASSVKEKTTPEKDAKKQIDQKNKSNTKENPLFLTPKKVLNDVNESAKDNDKYQFAEDLASLQKKLIAFRMETVVGYWVDILSNEIYEILLTEKANKNNDFKSVYSGYIILNDTKYMKQKLNIFARWKSEDLVFQFKIDGSKAFFINNNKMINNAMINVFNAKGLITISIPNGRNIYLAPLIANLKPEVYNDFYLPIKDQYNNKSPEAIRKEKINISDIDPIVIDNYSSNAAVNSTGAFILGSFSFVTIIALFFLGINI